MASATNYTQIRVTVDITGMYFNHTAIVPSTATVEDVMKKTQADTAGTFPRLTFARESGSKFLKTISVEHKGGTAQSRQRVSNTAPPRQFPDGVYSYSDDLTTKEQPGLVWQYYVTDKNGLSKSGQVGGLRRIVPFSVSSGLADGDVIVWRLVGIFSGPTGSKPAKYPKVK